MFIRVHAPQPQDLTNRRGQHRTHVDDVDRTRNREKLRVRARLEHPFLAIKRLLCFATSRYRGDTRNRFSRLSIECTKPFSALGDL